MKTKSKPIFILLFFILFSCSEKSNLIEVRNDDGIVVERYTELIENREKTGPFEKFTPNGNLAESGSFKNGKLDQERIVYFPDKTVINYIEHYKDGEFEGKYQYFYENGQIEFEGTYKEGVMAGNWDRFYQNGQLRESVAFVDNQENGPFIEYFENGNLKAEGNYKDGDNEDGLLKLYNEAGQLERKMECDSGRCATIWELGKED